VLGCLTVRPRRPFAGGTVRPTLEVVLTEVPSKRAEEKGRLGIALIDIGAD